MKLQTFFFTTAFPIMGGGEGGVAWEDAPPSYNSFRKTSTKTNALTVKPLHWFWVNNKFFMKRSKVAFKKLPSEHITAAFRDNILQNNSFSAKEGRFFHNI